MNRALFAVWLMSVLAASPFVYLIERSNHIKAQFHAEATARVQGTVVSIEEQRGKYIRYLPTLEFIAGNGERMRFRSNFHDSYPPSKYRVGQQLMVRYVPTEPSRAELDDPSLADPDALIMRNGMLGFVAFMTLVCGGLYLISRKKQSRPA